jgi:hypothetical protein
MSISWLSRARAPGARAVLIRIGVVKSSRAALPVRPDHGSSARGGDTSALPRRLVSDASAPRKDGPRVRVGRAHCTGKEARGNPRRRTHPGAWVRPRAADGTRRADGRAVARDPRTKARAQAGSAPRARARAPPARRAGAACRAPWTHDAGVLVRPRRAAPTSPHRRKVAPRGCHSSPAVRRAVRPRMRPLDRTSVRRRVPARSTAAGPAPGTRTRAAADAASSAAGQARWRRTESVASGVFRAACSRHLYQPTWPSTRCPECPPWSRLSGRPQEFSLHSPTLLPSENAGSWARAGGVTRA